MQLNESHMASPPPRGTPAAKVMECATGAGAELARAGWSPQDTVWQRRASEEDGPAALEVPAFGQRPHSSDEHNLAKTAAKQQGEDYNYTG